MDIPTKFLLSFLLHLSYCSGIPGAGVPQKYHMLSKNDTGVVLMPESEQTHMDAMNYCKFNQLLRFSPLVSIPRPLFLC